jgi:hypothetical protein
MLRALASHARDHNEDSEHYVYASLNHDTARTSRRILIAKTIRHVHPDTQAEVSISNDLTDVDRLTGRTVQLKGVVDGAAQLSPPKWPISCSVCAHPKAARTV